ncbi:MAG: hypothetical protein Q9217_000260 [Psora testacea]
MEITFKHVELFGGAIEANLPSNFVDVSDIRQVPDEQEVYLSANGFSSLIFDLRERISHLSTDKEALEYHLDDIIDEGDDKRIWTTNENLELPNFPQVKVLSLLVTTTPPAPEPDMLPRPNTPTHTDILLTLIRLELQLTDMLVALNIPHITGSPEAVAVGGEERDFEKGKYGSAIDEGNKVMEKVVRSLLVKDWGLFGPGG